MRRFRFLDGRIVSASSPLVFFESLRLEESMATPDLDSYLEIIRSRGDLGFGLDLDVGRRGELLGDRCARAFASLIAAGWVRPIPGSA